MLALDLASASDDPSASLTYNVEYDECSGATKAEYGLPVGRLTTDDVARFLWKKAARIRHRRAMCQRPHGQVGLHQQRGTKGQWYPRANANNQHI